MLVLLMLAMALAMVLPPMVAVMAATEAVLSPLVQELRLFHQVSGTAGVYSGP